jgi:hypothetical protein
LLGGGCTDIYEMATYTELTKDPIIDTHLSELEDTLLEQNLCRIIEPFSCVEIAHVAKIIDLPIHSVEKKYVAHRMSFPSKCLFPRKLHPTPRRAQPSMKRLTRMGCTLHAGCLR